MLALLTVVTLQHTLAPVDLTAWGWQIAFFIGALCSLVVIYLRRSMTETTTAEHMSHNDAGSIFALLKHRRALILVLVFSACGSLYFYTFTTYMQKLLVVSAGLAPETVSVVMTASLIFFMMCQPIFGLLADRIGVKAHMLLFTGFAALLTVPILRALQSVSSPYAAFALVDQPAS